MPAYGQPANIHIIGGLKRSDILLTVAVAGLAHSVDALV